ncbi:MAG TPA: pitrilysin family protein [Nevskiaceae bacterium]
MQVRRRTWGLFLALACAAGLGAEPALAEEASAPDVARATLDNGLRVVVVRNPLAPVVTTEMNYLVGSNEAPAGFPGTAHATEHMMFRGSPGLSQDQLAQIGALMGGGFDADTTQTVTQYYFSVPTHDLDVALHIAALRMRGLDVDPDAWHEERGAIEQEVSRDLSDPGYRFYTQLLGIMFKGTPYAHDALGTRASFNRTPAKLLRDFHATWYAPNNAIFVIVGDVDPAQVIARVKTLFGSIPAKKLPGKPAIHLQAVQAQTFHLTTDQPDGTVAMAWRLPGYRSPDYAASVILSDVLGSRRGAINQLVPQGKALSAGFSQNAFEGAGLGFAEASFAKGQDAQALVKELAARVASVRSNGVPAALVMAAKRQEVAALEEQKTSISGLANAWSTALAFQGLDSPDAMKTALEAVTVAQVDRLAREALEPSLAITAILTPEPSGAAVASQGFGGAESFTPKVTKPVALPAWAQELTKVPPVPDDPLHPTVQTLPNGIRLIVQPESVSDTVSVFGEIHTHPSLQEPQGQEGVASVLGDLFGYGGGDLDRDAYQAALDDIGAQESGGTSFELVVPAAHFRRGLQLLARNELQPQLPEAAFRIVRSQMAQALVGEMQSPGYLFDRALVTHLLPAGDPELRHATPQSVSALSLQDVKNYYRAVFRPDETTMVIIGNVSAKAARTAVEQAFGGWQATGPKPDLALPAVPDNKASAHWVPDHSASQDTVVLAETTGITISNPQHYALDLGDALLGQGFYASRLYRDLRANTGLVYTVGSSFELGDTRSNYVLNYACDPDNVSKAKVIALRDLEEMRTEPVGRDDLDRAKALMLRQLPLGHASFGDIAEAWLYYSQHHLPLNQATVVARKVVELSPADVQAAFAKWLRPDDLVQVVRGPQPH